LGRNYKKMSLVAGVDLVKYPDRALDLTNAIPIMFVGMKQGIFTGKKFADFFNKSKQDWVNARRSSMASQGTTDRQLRKEILQCHKLYDVTGLRPAR